jgi:hypothetical protein
METQFDLILVLVPIALVIALRLYAAKKKKEDDAERAKLATFLAQAVSSDSKPAKPREIEFDAFALTPDEDEVLPEVPADFYGRSASPAPKLQQGPMGLVGVNGTPGSPLLAEPIQPSEPRSTPSGKGDAHGAHPSDRFFARVNRLSPLQRAVVMAELLGTPKGM